MDPELEVKQEWERGRERELVNMKEETSSLYFPCPKVTHMLFLIGQN